MKLRNFLFIPLISLLLTNCNADNKLNLFKNASLTNINDVSVPEVVDIDQYTHKIDASNLETLIKSKEAFAFYYYSNNCESCSRVNKNIANYIHKENTLIYSASIDDLTLSSYENLYNKYKEIFRPINNISFPYFVIINDSKLYNEIPYEILSDYTKLETYMHQNVATNNVYSTNTAKDTKFLINNYETNYVFFYNKDKEFSNDILNNYILTNIKYSNLIIVDEYFFNDEQDLADIHAYSGIKTNHNPYLVKYEKTRITARLDITFETSKYIKTFLN